MGYMVMSFNRVEGCWKYMQSAKTFGKACEIAEQLRRQIPKGRFEVFTEFEIFSED